MSLGTQYVTIPEKKNMVAEDAEQTLKDMGLRVTKSRWWANSVCQRRGHLHQPAAGETVEGDTGHSVCQPPEVARDVTCPA